MYNQSKNIRDFDSLFDMLDYFNTEDACIDYLANEYTFRYNNRKMTDGSKFDVCIANATQKLTYKALIKNV